MMVANCSIYFNANMSKQINFYSLNSSQITVNA